MSVVERFEHDGVEGLRVGRFKLGFTTTCLVYRMGRTVIDTGPPNQWRAVRGFLRERAVHRVLITHHHEDHSGNGARIHAETQASVLVPPSGRHFVERGFPLRLYQRIIWGRPDSFRAVSVPQELEPQDGFRLRAHHTPGHSLDMTCYLEPERGWLFTGDLYIASKTRYLRADEDVQDQIRSLRQALRLDFETLFCAHRGVVTDGRQAIERKLDYLESLREQVRTLHRQGRSRSQIARRLLGREGLMSWITGYHFSKSNLIDACLTPANE